jgi:hypothetical protein
MKCCSVYLHLILHALIDLTFGECTVKVCNRQTGVSYKLLLKNGRSISLLLGEVCWSEYCSFTIVYAKMWYTLLSQ